VLEFLGVATPPAWVEAAAGQIETLLNDHAALELKAAQQAQRLIWKYAMPAAAAGVRNSRVLRHRLMHSMSRLAREELRHFEQVLAAIEARGMAFSAVTSSRYAAGLHAEIRKDEPARLVDTLLVGAIIEARSCERFHALQPALVHSDPDLARFYASLLRAESRHFRDYLALAELAADGSVAGRCGELLAVDAALVCAPDAVLRFHSGVPTGRRLGA
jgi:tRNA-(ms[2]io[6]A)-hydroxylase